MNIPLSWVAAMILGAVAAPAFAASFASASIGPLNIRLIDLNPLDGVTPWITFADAGSGNASYVIAIARQPTYAEDRQEAYGATPWAPLDVNAKAAGGALASASISGSINGNGSGLSASGSSADFSSPNYDSSLYHASARAPSSVSGRFTLSANTVVVISGAAHVAAAATWSNNQYSGDYAQSAVSLYIGGIGVGGRRSASDSIDVEGRTNYTDHEFNRTGSRTLAVSFVNLTNGDLGGNLRVRADAYGYTYTQASAVPVPEPETYALMLAGLAAIGLLARRRRV